MHLPPPLFVKIAAACWLVSAAALAAPPSESSSLPLGSPAFLPSPERPVGWRGDGTGAYPGANPPLTWSRRVSSGAVTDALYLARKPKAGMPASAAQPLELGIVKDWLVLGPFSCEDPERDIDKPFIPDEAEIRPDENDKSGALTWQLLHSTIDTQSTHYTNEGTCANYNVDFVYLFGRLNKQVAYAHTYLYSPSGGDVQISIRRSGAAAKIWLNGRATNLDPKDWNHIFKAKVTLDKGWNRLLVKLSCDQSSGPEGQNEWISKWLFSAYLSAPLPASYQTNHIAWMARLPGFSASSPVVVGQRLYATCGTSDLICLNKSDGRVLWLTTCTPCDAATPEDKAVQGYQDTVEPLAAQLQEANEKLVGELNASSALNGLSQEKQTSIDNRLKQKRDLEKKLHGALRAIDRKKYVPLYGNEVSGANGTPCTDGQRVYVAVGGGGKGPGAYVIAAYDLDGRRLWSYHEALGAGEHGTHVSPRLVDGKLIYGAKSTLLAFEAATGNVAWRNELPRDAENCVGCLFVPAKIGDTSVLVTFPNRVIRVSDGKVLSETPKEVFLGGLSTPVIDDGVLYSDFDFKKNLEGIRLPSAPESSPTVAWKLTEKQWRLEGSSGFSIASALAFNGLYYTVDTMGGLTVMDMATHAPSYIRRLEMFQRANRQTFGFTASPTLGGKHIYIFDNTGSALVLDPGTQYKETARNIIENQVASDWQDYKQELFYASPVFDGPALYLKGSEYLYCIRER
jgi:outer membrane protein assembly factor BamB